MPASAISNPPNASKALNHLANKQDHLKSKLSGWKPRERWEYFGVSGLTEPELLALIIGSGTREQSVYKISSQVWRELSKHKNSSPLTYDLLTKLNGVGKFTAQKILASLELGRRWYTQPVLPLNSPKTVAHQAQFLQTQKTEKVVVFYVNSRLELIHQQIIAQGNLNSAVIEAREFFSPAFTLPAAACFMVHNHPSGNTHPSFDDIKLTKKIALAGDLLGIELIDHLIIGQRGFSSLKSLGYLPLSRTQPATTHLEAGRYQV